MSHKDPQVTKAFENGQAAKEREFVCARDKDIAECLYDDQSGKGDRLSRVLYGLQLRSALAQIAVACGVPFVVGEKDLTWIEATIHVHVEKVHDNGECGLEHA